MKREKVRVTDHAVLRYMERGQGFNIEAVRKHIQDVCEPVAAVGGSALKAEGVKFAITNNAVTTVMPDSPGVSRTTTERISQQMARAAS